MKKHHLGVALATLFLIKGVSASVASSVTTLSRRARTLRGGGGGVSTKTEKEPHHSDSSASSDGSYDGGSIYYYSGDEEEEEEEQQMIETTAVTPSPHPSQAAASTGAVIDESTTTAINESSKNNKCDMSPTQRMATLRPIILTITPEGILNNVNSPQAKALHWLVNEDTIDPPICPPMTMGNNDTSVTTVATLLQRYIMAAFYYATNGDNWKECTAPIHYTSTSVITNANEKKCTRTITAQSSEVLAFVLEQAFSDTTTTAEQQQHGRKIGTQAWLTPVDTCDWGGLACSYYNISSGYYAIDQIEFEDNNLSGTLLPELSALSQLRFLILEKGQLHGPIPNEYGHLSNLRVLDMDYNKLSGPIPNELYDLVGLRELDLNDNRLSGTISSRVGMLSNLVYVQLDNNEFVGNVPEEVGELNELGEYSHVRKMFLRYYFNLFIHH